MLILVCAKYYVLETKNIGDMTKFSELPEQPSYIFYPGAIFIKHLREKLKYMENFGTELQQKQITLLILKILECCKSYSVLVHVNCFQLSEKKTH